MALLNKWKNKNLFPKAPQRILTYENEISMLGLEGAKTHLLPLNQSRFALFERNERQLALFHHVGVWAWGNSFETGNYLPHGASTMDALPESRRETNVNFRCQFTFAFDTSKDGSLWELQTAVERFALSDAQFNTAQKPRRAWQGERDESANRRYLLNIPMFFQKGKGGAPPLPYEPHPLVQKALEDNPTWYANPERPKPFSMEGKKLVDLKDATEPTFRRGDVVWMTFSVQLILGAKAWWTELVPKCFVRVGRVPMDTSTLDATLSVSPTTISVFSVGNFEFSDDVEGEDEGTTEGTGPSTDTSINSGDVNSSSEVTLSNEDSPPRVEHTVCADRVPSLTTPQVAQDNDYYDRYLEAAMRAEGLLVEYLHPRRSARGLRTSGFVSDEAMEDEEESDDDDYMSDEGDSVDSDEFDKMDEGRNESDGEDGWLVIDDTSDGSDKDIVCDDNAQDNSRTTTEDSDYILQDFPMTSPITPPSDVTSDVDEVMGLSPLTEAENEDEVSEEPVSNTSETESRGRRLTRTRTRS
ncbi:hypothetical protein EIP86_009328 [Pleurotus ostreatoroseus]|nr:hypothetical protein EIP86_009328 [Pleurotus ostreatoroseus]